MVRLKKAALAVAMVVVASGAQASLIPPVDMGYLYPNPTASASYTGSGPINMVWHVVMPHAYQTVSNTLNNVTIELQGFSLNVFDGLEVFFGGSELFLTTTPTPVGNVHTYTLSGLFAGGTQDLLVRADSCLSSSCSFAFNNVLLEVKSTVPLPGTLALVGLALLGLGMSRRRA